ncbi:Tn3 family transposase [Nonomuraea sp. NPDC051941]|uniref:Tn3 family transposase n=1 Tax=Nonomuraea sp. NPDC051941 TaxID=3364373 RepID=UPI0037CB7BEA
MVQRGKFVQGEVSGYEAARHIPGVSGHELSMAANRHFSIGKLNETIADVVNAHARLDMSQEWGNGTTVAADGTHMDTYLNSLRPSASSVMAAPRRSPSMLPASSTNTQQVLNTARRTMWIAS